MNETKQKLSKLFSTARIYALVSIVTAHISFSPKTFVDILFNRVGSIGVIAFIIMAGYFYNAKKFPTVVSLVRNKCKTICIPWCFLGTLSYIYKAIAGHNGFQVDEYFKWILGNGTYLYYMTVLVLCYLLFFRTNKIILYASIVVTPISLQLTAFGVLDPIIQLIRVTNYLNIFNWIGFFALGILISEQDKQWAYTFLKKARIVILFVFSIVLVFFLVLKDIALDYFSHLGFIYELLGAAALFALSTWSITDIKVFQSLSNSSFTIYLVNVVFIGLLDNFFGTFLTTKFLSPLIVIAFAYGSIYLFDFLSRKLNLNLLYRNLVGIRNK